MGDVIIICLQAFVLHYILRNRKSSDYQDRKAQFYHDTVEWKKTIFSHTLAFRLANLLGAWM